MSKELPALSEIQRQADEIGGKINDHREHHAKRNRRRIKNALATAAGISVALLCAGEINRALNKTEKHRPDYPSLIKDANGANNTSEKTRVFGDNNQRNIPGVGQ